MIALDDQQVAATARSLGLTVHPITVHRSEVFTAAFQSMTTNRDQGLLVMATPFAFLHAKEIVELAAKHRLVAIYEGRAWVEAGGLVSFGATHEVARLGAVLVDKILRGAKPADLPVEQPIKFELVINVKTAKALGLTIPPSLLLRADEAIQ